MMEVNCETDFVAKNDDFLALTRALADMVVSQNPADVAALSAMPYNGTDREKRPAPSWWARSART
jgi:elongation factor Ts